MNYSPCRRVLRATFAPIFAVLWLIATDSFANDDVQTDDSLIRDVQLYFTAPIRWDSQDWLYFGGTVAAIGLAHRYDDDARKHFIAKNPSLAANTESHSLSDAVPAAAALVGTWAYATLIRDREGHREAWSMAEAAVLSSATGFVLKYAAGRERPNETSDANSWRAGGDAFPSLHSTAAFAIGTVLAESGDDDYRWPRRALGYGIGILTSYQRMKHHQHWLSDTVGGAALGMSTAHFVINRRNNQETNGGHLSVMPAAGGVLLSYSKSLR